MISHYATLGVPETAQPEEIRSAYRRLAREVHPDVNPAGAERFYALAAAYDVLSDPVRRREYDAELTRWHTSIGAMSCPKCGTTNRVPPFRADQKPVCRRCKADLGVTEKQRRATAREALIYQAATVAEDLGGEMLAMAHDALRLGIGRLRQRWGLGGEAETLERHRTFKKR